VRRLRQDRGAITAFVALFMVGFMGLMAIAIDAGSWYRSQRRVQASADAAALAGAQDLPNTGAAAASATNYADLNAPGLDPWSPTFPSTSPCAPDSCIDVKLSRSAPGFFAKVLGINSVTVHGHALAGVGSPSQIRHALPVAVSQSVVCLTGSVGCFDTPKTLTFDETSTVSFGSSTWGLLDLSGSATTSSACSGNVGQSQQSGWVVDGYDGLLAINRYYGSSTGQRIAVRNALNDRIGEVLLVPVFASSPAPDKSWCTSGGFYVIGWAAFVIDQTIPNGEWNPQVKTLHGHFTEYIAHDVESTIGAPGFGVKVISLLQ
jgi:Putative Flp pilus-assembly TadE/G-like